MTPRQLSYVNRATALLPPAARPAFHQAVATMLGYAQHPLDDRDLLDLLRIELAQYGHSISAVYSNPAREYARYEGRRKHHAATTGSIF
jgi:hypothetical protein